MLKPILTCPDFQQQFQLETDSSDTGLGAVLTQNIINIWRIRDNQLYFFKPDPLESCLNLNDNPWKLTIPKELRDQVLRENHYNKRVGHLGMEKHMQELQKIIFSQRYTLSH